MSPCFICTGREEMDFTKCERLLADALQNGVFPCYAAAVGRGDEVWFLKAEGCRMLFPEPKPLTEDTLFDMASLSKLIGTTMATLRLIEDGKLALFDSLGAFFDDCHGKEDLTVRELMTHTSGISAHIPLYTRGIRPKDAADLILREPLAYPTGSETVYSCMGYILLGKILEKMEGEPLDLIVKRLVLDPLSMKESCYRPKAGTVCAATELDPVTGAYIDGVVHDENARFLGGVSGNAGLFCTLNDTVRFAQMLSYRGKGFLSPRMFELAVTDFTPMCEESRGLGFQLYGGKRFPGGDLMSPGSYGHTGFTGTSVYVDNKTGVYVVLLTNRVHPSREDNRIIAFRRHFHNTIFASLEE